MSGSTATRPGETDAGAGESPREASPLLRLLDHGQSCWLDNLTRGMIRRGELRRRVEEEGLRGVTSNPAIFNKAISGGSEYDEQLRELAAAGRSAYGIFEGLAVADIQDACDVLRPVFDDSGGTDGFVSLEVSPYLAHDTEGTIAEACRLYELVDRPNVLIKIPGTTAGVPAIEEALYRGTNVNVTLLFSIEAYEAVARAYLRALERRLEEGKPIDGMASVASFFLSRIDVLVDGILGHRIRPGAGDVPGPRPETLLGKAAVANAKLAYESFERIFGSERWAALAAEGASPQRMLWASTSTKDPLYSDVRYVEPLIGPETVNTMPEGTIEAFADHGAVAETVRDGLDEARDVMVALEAAGIDFEAVTSQLLDEGVQKFIDPFDALMETLEERRRSMLGTDREDAVFSLADLGPDVSSGLDSLQGRQFPRLLREANPWVWTDDREEAEAIAARLGWLRAPGEFAHRVDDIVAFADGIAPPDFRHVVHIGMGGSSLAADVARRIFGSAEGRPELLVLDDTDPDAIRDVEERIDLRRTLFVVASKSGTTTETTSIYSYFHERVREAVGDGAGSRFVAVTDPGTPLAREARDRGFRRTFENPTDVGGRYSALTFFGLVPMALAGIDVGELLDRGREMLLRSDASLPAEASPGIRLGAALGMAARTGRDKVTFLAGPELAPFGDWVEQLLAESTGKDGKGIVPVVGEPPAPPEAYADDRLFVHLALAGSAAGEPARTAEALREAGHPVISCELADRPALGAEFVRWEVATATAGAILGVNPFDEPNVGESKRNTREMLVAREESGALPEEPPALESEGIRLFADGSAGWLEGADGSVESALRALVDTARPGDDYLALLPYLAPTPAREGSVQALRKGLRDRLRVPVTAGRGPRYLHSTGQLHKGGPDAGVFLLVTADPEADVPVPGESYDFATLQRAQALGDYRALAERGRRVVRLHLSGDVDGQLARLAAMLG